MSVVLVLVAFAIGGFVGMVLTCLIVAGDYDASMQDIIKVLKMRNAE